jgi:hypothetical protein
VLLGAGLLSFSFQAIHSPVQHRHRPAILENVFRGRFLDWVDRIALLAGIDVEGKGQRTAAPLEPAGFDPFVRQEVPQ